MTPVAARIFFKGASRVQEIIGVVGGNAGERRTHTFAHI